MIRAKAEMRESSMASQITSPGGRLKLDDVHLEGYASVGDAKAAISRYFEERKRTRSFLTTPRKAGRTIWGEEPAPSVFLETSNCKDAKYR